MKKLIIIFSAVIFIFSSSMAAQESVSATNTETVKQRVPAKVKNSRKKSVKVKWTVKALWESVVTPSASVKSRARLEMGASRYYSRYKLTAAVKLRIEQWVGDTAIVTKLLDAYLYSKKLPFVNLKIGRWSYKYSDTFYLGQYIFGYGQIPMYPVREVNGIMVQSKPIGPLSFSVVNLMQNDFLSAGVIGNISLRIKKAGIKIGLNSLSSFDDANTIILSKIPAGHYTAYSVNAGWHPSLTKSLKGFGLFAEAGAYDTDENSLKYTVGMDLPRLQIFKLLKLEAEKQTGNDFLTYGLTVLPKSVLGINVLAQVLGNTAENTDITTIIKFYKTF